jgi:hypothetical protein
LEQIGVAPSGQLQGATDCPEVVSESVVRGLSRRSLMPPTPGILTSRFNPSTRLVRSSSTAASKLTGRVISTMKNGNQIRGRVAFVLARLTDIDICINAETNSNIGSYGSANYSSANDIETSTVQAS